MVCLNKHRVQQQSQTLCAGVDDKRLNDLGEHNCRIFHSLTSRHTEILSRVEFSMSLDKEH